MIPIFPSSNNINRSNALDGGGGVLEGVDGGRQTGGVGQGSVHGVACIRGSAACLRMLVRALPASARVAAQTRARALESHYHSSPSPDAPRVQELVVAAIAGNPLLLRKVLALKAGAATADPVLCRNRGSSAWADRRNIVTRLYRLPCYSSLQVLIRLTFRSRCRVCGGPPVYPHATVPCQSDNEGWPGSNAIWRILHRIGPGFGAVVVSMGQEMHLRACLHMINRAQREEQSGKSNN